MTDSHTRSRAVPILLVVSLVWGVLILVASFWLPVYTLNTNAAGVQPRLSVWTEFGVAGLIPAIAVIVIAVAESSLLLPDTRVALRMRVLIARTLSLIVAGAAFVSVAFLHLEGLFFIVFATLLILASWLSPTRRDVDH